MGRKLIATLGTSPGGVFESYSFLSKAGIDVNEVVIITTKEPLVQLAFSLVKKEFECLASNVKVSQVELPFADIEKGEDYRRLLALASHIISPNDYVDITGGRKIISLGVGLVASNNSATVITTIIPSDEYKRVTDLVAKLKEKASKNELTCEDVKTLVSEKARTVIL